MAKRGTIIKLTTEQQKLAASNLNLARNIAWKYQRSTNIEYSILESAAFEGLCQAAARYDAELINEDTNKPMKFSSLAVPYIRGSILHYIRDKTYSMRLTHKMRELWLKGRKLVRKGMTDIEICKELDIDIKEWQDTKTACSGPPLELKDQTRPIDCAGIEELDQLSPFRELAAQLLERMDQSLFARLDRYCTGRTTSPSATLRNDLTTHLRMT
jgi:RNA polymerase sigma-B factor